ncbi:MAG: flagellin [Acidobacteriia bacterium]|nr:flagellin [Terriglobia bacterium]
MSFSIQTNVNSLVAQENLRVNSNFQSQTIQRLTSGYRINSSGDDAAGLAIANKFRSDTAELTQGVRNANDAVSQLQIIDGGMNNVSKMLDRLRTLAAQSASDTFTGNRDVLNKEFTNVLNEIDRQAQSIGLDTSGQFAKALSVFVGGGRTHTTGDISTVNGSVTVDLSASSVDSASLGLKGMQLVAGSVDIGSATSAQSVSKLMANGSNTHASGVTDFYFAGAGFADAAKVKVSVSLTGVTDIDTLVANINTAVATAGNGGTDAAKAFKAAGISATVNTDSNGGKQVAFSSSAGAFQVEAGDVLANAFMGNITSGSVNGEALNTTTTTGNATGGVAADLSALYNPTGSNAKVQIMGAGMDAPISIALRGDGGTTIAQVIGNLITDIGADDTLSAAGITASGGQTGTASLVFTSARGEKLSVMVTGDTKNYLGFGTFLVGKDSDNNPLADYSSIAGTGTYANTGASQNYGTAHFQFSINGGTSTTDIGVNLDAGDAKAAAVTGVSVAPGVTASFDFYVNGGVKKSVGLLLGDSLQQIADKINAAADGVTATLVAGALTLTENSGATGHSSSIRQDAASGVNLGISTTVVYGAGRTEASLLQELNEKIQLPATGIPASAGLKATGDGSGTITFSSDTNTNFRLSISGTQTNASIGFGAANNGPTSFTAPVTAAAANAALVSGNSNTLDMAFTAMQFGNDAQTLTFSATDSSGVLKSNTLTLKNDNSADANARSGRSIDEAVDYVNEQLQTFGGTLSKIVAVKSRDTDGVEKINFLSSLSSFNVTVGSCLNSEGVNNGAAVSKDSDTMSTGSINVANQTSAKQAVAALASAVSLLGTAQAAVGKGQNQLSYAVGLAQSQISNFSAAESRIRDADVASEAANLTKAQVLQQASIAAMAQANSAPQAVLALLRG